MLFNLDFANNTILSCFFFFLINFLNPAFITKLFNPIAELVIPTGIPTKEAKSEMGINPVIVEIIISNNSKLYRLFFASYSLIHFDLFL